MLATWIQAECELTVSSAGLRHSWTWIHSKCRALATTYTTVLAPCLLTRQLLPPHRHLKCMTNYLVTFLKGKSVKRRKTATGFVGRGLWLTSWPGLTWNTISWYNQTSEAGQWDSRAAACMSCGTGRRAIIPLDSNSAQAQRNKNKAIMRQNKPH